MPKHNAREMLTSLAHSTGRSEEDVFLSLVEAASRSPHADGTARAEIVPSHVGPPAAPARPDAASPVPFQPAAASMTTPTGHTVHSESDRQAYVRWLEGELRPSGVFGSGGMSPGGIFGEAPVATGGYDPAAEHRAAAMQYHQAPGQPVPFPAAIPQQLPAPAPPMVRMMHYQGPSFTMYEGPAQMPAMPPMPFLPWQR